MRTTILLIALCAAHVCSAQDQYETKVDNEHMEIQGKWKFPVKKGVEQPGELLLKMVNKSDAAVTVTFDLEYSLGVRNVETFIVDTCMKAGKTMTGKLNGLYFISSNLSNEQLKSEDFEWAIESLQTEEIDSCPVDK